MKTLQSEKWACSRCTYVNFAKTKKCAMCQSSPTPTYIRQVQDNNYVAFKLSILAVSWEKDTSIVFYRLFTKSCQIGNCAVFYYLMLIVSWFTDRKCHLYRYQLYFFSSQTPAHPALRAYTAQSRVVLVRRASSRSAPALINAQQCARTDLTECADRRSGNCCTILPGENRSEIRSCRRTGFGYMHV